MRFLIALIGSITFFSCKQDMDPFDYSNSFLQLVDSCDADFDYLGRQIDRMGSQVKANVRIDSALFKASIAITAKITRKFEIMTDSLGKTDSYKNDDRIKKKTIELLRLYNREILPVYTVYLTAHYNVYGKNDILKMENSKQDSLNQMIIKASESMLEAMDRRINESENIKRFINDWIQAFKTPSSNRAKVTESQKGSFLGCNYIVKNARSEVRPVSRSVPENQRRC